jgi:hypothetical protein
MMANEDNVHLVKFFGNISVPCGDGTPPTSNI